VPGLLKTADVLVLPSLYESCGSVVIEAMGVAIPCITMRNVDGVSEVGASGEINLDGVTGFCVDPLDPADMANRLNELALCSDKRGKMGAAACKRVQDSFTWELAAREYLSFAEEVIRNNSKTHSDLHRTETHGKSSKAE
jgi:glycosyltransferase involved in cell wall biosynthesis